MRIKEDCVFLSRTPHHRTFSTGRNPETSVLDLRAPHCRCTVDPHTVADWEVSSTWPLSADRLSTSRRVKSCAIILAGQRERRLCGTSRACAQFCTINPGTARGIFGVLLDLRPHYNPKQSRSAPTPEALSPASLRTFPER